MPGQYVPNKVEDNDGKYRPKSGGKVLCVQFQKTVPGNPCGSVGRTLDANRPNCLQHRLSLRLPAMSFHISTCGHFIFVTYLLQKGAMKRVH